MHVRVYNYNTLEKVHTFEAHSDYIRSIVVHPTHPYILTCSGKIWWDGERERKEYFNNCIKLHVQLELV